MTPSIEQVAQAAEILRTQRQELENKHRAAMNDVDARLEKIEAWLWQHSSRTADSMVEEYVAFRDRRSDIKKEYDAEDFKIKELMALRENALQVMMDEINAQSLRTEHGTAYKQIKTRASTSDWEATWNWMFENQRADLLEKRISQTMINNLIKDGKDLPPGVSIFQETEVTVRRA